MSIHSSTKASVTFSQGASLLWLNIIVGSINKLGLLFEGEHDCCLCIDHHKVNNYMFKQLVGLQHHRVTEIGGTSGLVQVPCSEQGQRQLFAQGSVLSISPRMEMPQSLWASCSSV